MSYLPITTCFFSISFYEHDVGFIMCRGESDHSRSNFIVNLAISDIKVHFQPETSYSSSTNFVIDVGRILLVATAHHETGRFEEKTLN